MRRAFLGLLLALSLLVLAPCSLADSIVNVNLQATYTASQPCTVSCTEFLSIDFLYDQTILPRDQWNGWLFKPVGIVPGSMQVASGGFMGQFHWLGLPQCCEGYIPFVDTNDTHYDEFDILFATTLPDTTQFKPGIYSAAGFGSGVGTQIFTCRTAGCVSAFGSGAVAQIQPEGYFVITAVSEPQPGQLLCIGAIIVMIRTYKRPVSAD